MPKDIQDNVVVITGASSGIGRAAALEFARHGAHVIVAARRENLLQDVAHEYQQLNGRDALAVVTDVSNEQSVQDLARQAFERFGHIDMWINNAGRLAGAVGTELPLYLSKNPWVSFIFLRGCTGLFHCTHAKK